MNTIARREVVVVVIITLCFLLLLMPALVHARRERRDGIRREALAALKIQLEQYYNKHNIYPVTFETGDYEYIVTKENNGAAIEWYLRTRLENNPTPTAAFDAEAGFNLFYRIQREGDHTVYEVCGGEATCGVIREE